MKIFILLCLLPFIIHAKSSVNLLAGSIKNESFDRGSSYAIQYSYTNKNNLGYDVGFGFSTLSTDTNSYSQIRLLDAGIIQQFTFNRLPFVGFIGAGFGLVGLNPGDYGRIYIGSYLKAGIKYRMSRQTMLIGEYRANYGETKIDNQTTSFDSSKISVGIGFLLPRPKQKTLMPKGQQRYQTPRNNAPRRPNRQTNRQKSTYQQTQKLMNDLSWPTY